MGIPALQGENLAQYKQRIGFTYAQIAIEKVEREAEVERIEAAKTDKRKLTPQEFGAHLRDLGVTDGTAARMTHHEPELLGPDARLDTPEEFRRRQGQHERPAPAPQPTAPGGDARTLSDEQWRAHCASLGIEPGGSSSRSAEQRAELLRQRAEERDARLEQHLATLAGALVPQPAPAPAAAAPSGETMSLEMAQRIEAWADKLGARPTAK